MKKTRLSSVASLLAAGVLMGGCMGDFGGEFENESEGVAAQEPDVGGGEALGEVVGEAQKALIPGVWTAWQKLTLPVTTQHSPTISSRGNGTFDVFVLGKDRNIYMQSYAHGKFGQWANLGTPPGVTFVSAPDAASSDANSFAVTALGSNGIYYLNTWTAASGKMSGWKPVQGLFRTTYGPGMSSRGSGVLNFYGPGLLDGKTWASGMLNGNPAYAGTQLGSPLNQPLKSNVTSVSWDPSVVHLYARGQDNSLYSRWWSSAAGWNPQGWVGMGGKFTSGFGVASWAPGHLDVFGLGTDSKVYQIQYDAGWTGFSLVGGPPVGLAAGSAPDAVSSGPGRIHLVVRGDDNQPWMRSFTAFPGAITAGGIRRTAQVSGSYGQGVTVKSDGTVWAVGTNSQKQFVIEQVKEQTKPLTDVVAVASGEYHHLALKRDGTVWAWGWNEQGQLGYMTPPEAEGSVFIYRSTVAKPVPGLKDVVAVEAGEDYSLAIQKDGTLWAWGGNSEGQLGDGTRSTGRLVPYKVMTDVVSVSAGQFHTLAVKRNGTVYSWGKNFYRQLGYATGGYGFNPNPTPKQVPKLEKVVQVSAGEAHSAALKSDGTVWTWGADSFNQLGYPTPNGDYNETPTQIPGLTGVVSIDTSYWATYQLALKADGTLWNWNSQARKTVMNGVVAMSGGYTHSLAVKSDGSLWTWNASSMPTPVLVPVPAKL